MADVVDVDAAGGDVGRHQHPGLAGAEQFQRPLAGILGLVAVDRLGDDAGLFQMLGDAVGAVLGAGEDDHPRPSPDRSAVRLRKLALRTARPPCRPAARCGRRCGVTGDTSMRSGERSMSAASGRFRPGMVAENSIDCRSFGTWPTIFRTSRMKPMSSMRSASSSTRWRDRVEPELALLHQVEQAARRSDQDIDAALQLPPSAAGCRRRRTRRHGAGPDDGHRRGPVRRSARPVRGSAPGSGRGCCAVRRRRGFPPASAASAARRPRSCRCRSGRCPGDPCRSAGRESPGSGSGWA